MMSFYQKMLLALFPYRRLDLPIAKLKCLAKQYEAHNRAYYGEYLSGILFD